MFEILAIYGLKPDFHQLCLAKLNFSSSFQTENNMEGKPSREE